MICYFLSTVYIDVSMDDNSGKSVAVNPNGANGTAQRDENRSPTSGSSSETTHDLPKGAEPTIRKHRRQSRAKRKRKWKPYTELSWDERQVQDDKETKRACAKRERLTAEGHPIAPYNTTQFLMDDHKLDSSMVEEKNSPRKNSSENLELSDDLKPGSDGTGVNSSVNEDDPTKPGDNLQSDSRDDIQQFILQDFSHTYADIHAEQLQSMSKQELINECLKLEKRVEHLERRLRDCKRKHSQDQAGTKLLDKLSQFQNIPLTHQAPVTAPDDSVFLKNDNAQSPIHKCLDETSIVPMATQ